jgi:2-polyprenyl-3-methyl-5-hydroxy-6-metoxy-1,4-benzoquinol methylase
MTMAHHPFSSLSDQELVERAGWMHTDTPAEEVAKYLRNNLSRIRQALSRVPPARSENQRLLDLGCYAAMIPWYVDILGYRDITAVAEEPRMHLNQNIRKIKGITAFRLHTAYLNVEEDPWPFEDESFHLVLCLELMEHMATDPMHLMEELNRVMVTGGDLILTTPNSASWASLARCMLGEQPYSWAKFYGIPGSVHRHNREYTPREVETLMQDGGLEIIELTTIEKALLTLNKKIVARLGGLIGLLTGRCPASHRRQKILVHARKDGPIRDRWPGWLYKDAAELADKLAEMGEKGRRRLDASA